MKFFFFLLGMHSEKIVQIPVSLEHTIEAIATDTNLITTTSDRVFQQQVFC